MNLFFFLVFVIMGSLDLEVKYMGDVDFVCNWNNIIDFVMYKVKYGC